MNGAAQTPGENHEKRERDVERSSGGAVGAAAGAAVAVTVGSASLVANVAFPIVGTVIGALATPFIADLIRNAAKKDSPDE